MTRALVYWLLAAVLSLLAAILATLGWRVLATLDDAWDIDLDPPRVNTRVNVHGGTLFVADHLTGRRPRDVFDDDAARFRMAERLALSLGRPRGHRGYWAGPVTP